MIGAGILDEDDRVELIEGVIVEMTPQGPKHATLIQRLCDPMFARVPPRHGRSVSAVPDDRARLRG